MIVIHNEFSIGDEVRVVNGPNKAKILEIRARIEDKDQSEVELSDVIYFIVTGDDEGGSFETAFGDELYSIERSMS